MQIKQFLAQFADLLVKSDEASRNWTSWGPLRLAWRRFVALLILVALTSVLVASTPLSIVLGNLSNGVYSYRVATAVAMALLIFQLGLLTVRYFQFTLLGKREVKLLNVLFFYIAQVFAFGILSFFIFLAEPTYFRVDPQAVTWWDSIGDKTAAAWKTKIYFVLYALFKSAGGSFDYIESRSLLTAFVNLVQSIYTFALVALLVAGYVNQRTTNNGA